jgi:predicted transcriptional regulator
LSTRVSEVIMPKKRKGIVQIRFEILEYLYYNPQPQPRTHVWRKATTLSYDDFVKHLEGLIEKELVSDIDGEVEISRKGRETYDKLNHVLFTIL